MPAPSSLLVYVGMAGHGRHIPIETRRTLLREAGGKCANPGCSNRLIEHHHIREWAIYLTHDAEHMIAICPSCHDQVDRGDLPLDDETLYRWKGIRRAGAERRDHLYVEPADEAKLLLGFIAVTGTNAGLLAFDFSPSSRLAFALHDTDVDPTPPLTGRRDAVRLLASQREGARRR